MAQRKNVLMLTLGGYSIRHSAECYTLSKDGDEHGKHNTYHSALDNAVVFLFEKLLPERVADKRDYHATMGELVAIVREVRNEIVLALSMAGIGGRSENSEKRHTDTAEDGKPSTRGVGA